MNTALTTVIDFMIDKLKNHKDAAFAIPADLISPDNATPDEIAALDAAGFAWVDDEKFRGYRMLFTETSATE